MTTERKQRLRGTVVSNKSQKTVVVEVTRLKQHPKYRKFIKISKRYKAHDPESAYKMGDQVVIESCRPISKDKRWVVIERLRAAKGEEIEAEA